MTTPASDNVSLERRTKNESGFDCELYDEFGSATPYIFLGYTKTRNHQMLMNTQATDVTKESLILVQAKTPVSPGAMRWLEKADAKKMKEAAQKFVSGLKKDEAKNLVVIHHPITMTDKETDNIARTSCPLLLGWRP